jgi:hypothetical protein
MKVGDLVRVNPTFYRGDEDQRAEALRLLKNGLIVEALSDGCIEILWPNGRMSFLYPQFLLPMQSSE